MLFLIIFSQGEIKKKGALHFTPIQKLEKMFKVHKLENFHILLWLLKDMSWLMTWRSFGVFMIIPTMTFAILIAWESRRYQSALFHNLAVICWITANSFWMISDFFEFEEWMRSLALIPFSLGLFLICFYHFKKLLKVSKKSLNSHSSN